MSSAIPNRAILKDGKVWLLIDSRDLLTTKRVCEFVNCKYHINSGMFDLPLTYMNVKTLMDLKFEFGKTLRDWERTTRQEKENNSIKLKNIKGLNGTPRPFQYRGVEFIDEVDGRALIADDPGLGKAQTLNSLISSPSGWIRMGDIRVGVSIFTKDGTIQNVEAVFPQGVVPTYRVTFTDDSFVDCNLDHLWSVTNNNRKRKGLGWDTKTTKEIIESGITYKSSENRKASGRKPLLKWEIPTCEPVQYPMKQFTIPAYTMGALIGDGSLNQGTLQLSLPEEKNEIIRKITNELPNNLEVFTAKYGNVFHHSLVKSIDKKNHNIENVYTGEIRRLNLNIVGGDKFIPIEYMQGSIRQRKRLLAGLMDSDGSCIKNRTVFHTSSKQLTIDIKELVESLGGIALVHSYDRTKENKGIEYQVNIRTLFNPFFLSYKKNSWFPRTVFLPTRRIKSIEYVGEEEQQCIRVSSPDHLYITNSYIVTHNTIQAITWCQLHIKERPVLVICPSSVKISWQRMADEWMDVVNVQILEGRTPYEITGDFVIINYDILNYWVNDLKVYGFKVLIADEAHYIRNSTSKRTKAFKQIARYFEKIIAMTGTPIENYPVEIFNIVNILNPKIFPNYYDFTKRFCDAKNDGFSRNIKGVSNPEELYRILTKTVMIRRKKSEVLTDLPPKNICVLPLEITNRKEYRTAELKFIEYLSTKFHTDLGKDGIEKELKAYAKLHDIEISDDLDSDDLAVLHDTKIEKAKAAPVLVQMGILKQLAVKGKMKAMIEWITDFLESGEKLVVFTLNRFVITELLKEFPDAVSYEGKTSKKNRQLAIDSFQTDESCKLFISNIDAGGIGITLTAASNVLMTQYPWTPGKFGQAPDRLHRMTQIKQVTVWNAVGANTIEEKIIKVLALKEQIITDVLDGGKHDTSSIASEIIKMYKIK